MLTNSRHTSSLFRSLRVCSLLAAAAGTTGLAGCSGGTAADALSPADFSAAVVGTEGEQDLQPLDAPSSRAPRTEESSDARVVTLVPIELDDDELTTTIPSPSPAAGPRAAMIAGAPQAAPPANRAETQPNAAAEGAPSPEPEAVPIDGLVGHINGQPVFASDMLSDLRGLMRAEAAKGTGLPGWQLVVAREIQEKLRRRVENELMLAESRESLTPQQRKGLQFVLDEIRGSMVREKGGGSALRAEQRLLASEERTLDEAVAERLDQELIRQELRTKIFPLVQVSYRDVKLRYERDFEKYNPPSEATFRVIRIASEPSAAIEQVKARIDAGEYEQVAAESINRYPDGGLVTRSFRGSLADQDLFFGVVEALNEVARELEPGQTSDPVELGNGDVAWVRLETLETPRPVSLYEAQLGIETELRNERLQRELTRYVERLRGEGSFTSEAEMTQHLTIIGARQHLDEIER